MRTAALLATLAILAVSFAGCSDGGDGDGTSTSSSPTASSSSSSSTSRSSTGSRSSSSTSAAPPPNKAPTGSVSASVNGTNATFSLTGSDQDKDALAWDLDFGDGNMTNGTSLPTNVTHSYGNRTGNLTASFTITDGKSPVTYNVTVSVGAAGGGPKAVVTGSTSQPGNPTTSLLFGANGCAGYNVGENGIDCVFGELPAGLDGRPFAFTSDAAAPDYELWDSCDAAMGAFVQEWGGPGSGTLPAGVGCVIMWNYGGGTGSFTFTVS